MPDASGYPARAYLNFYPGGITYSGGASEEHWYDLPSYCSSSLPSSTRRTSVDSDTAHSSRSDNNKTPEVLVARARAADDALYQLILSSAASNSSTPSSAPFFLPSLSVLAEAAFGRLTGVPAAHAKHWADALVLGSSSVGNSWNRRNSNNSRSESLTCVSVLKRLLQEQASAADANTRRPCGYLFKRGDIAWNCRTCQSDPTCVICDTCFRNSNHDGHEVYFHRTTPGGCCDCGDAEAWALDGCCAEHRPECAPTQVAAVMEGDAEEAVRAMYKAQRDGAETLAVQPSTALPPKLAAALGVVVGAAVNCLVQAVDGAGIGADPVQWKLRWADQACRVANGVVHDEEYCLKPKGYIGESLGSVATFPQSFRLQLRLHNDDVHTFDEVIDALHDPRLARRSSEDASQQLVTDRDVANEMTHNVDADGQVLVKAYPSVHSAFQGYHRLKTRGLHCAVLSSAQVDLEYRAKALTTWLGEISAAHPAAAALVVHALVQVSPNHDLAGVSVWPEPRMIPSWCLDSSRFQMFPPHLKSSYLTRDEAERLHRMALEVNVARFVELTGADPNFYDRVPYRLPSERYRKSPHSLWGTLPSMYSDTLTVGERHPFLHMLLLGDSNPNVQNRLTEFVLVVDTDLRKVQELDRITTSVYPHKLPGLYMISGVGTLPLRLVDRSPPPTPNPMNFRHLLETSSFRAPISPISLMLLLDPYPTKQLRASLHALFLSLLIDLRFKNRFAAVLGGVAYRPLTTLFCAGVGTDADTPLGFTVQIFTAGSLTRALGNAVATEKLLRSDYEGEDPETGAPVGVFTLPIAHNIVRCVHTNLLGSTKEVQMILKNTATGNDEDSGNDTELANPSLLSALSYVAGEHPLTKPLSTGHDDGFLDSKLTRHKRLPHLLRDLEYVMETPGTAIRLLLPGRYPVNPQLSAALRSDDQPSMSSELLSFATVWVRLLRTAQGMDLQKRKISGGHVEYEQNRWLEAFGLSLNFAGTRDALAESLTNSSSAVVAPVAADGSHLLSIREAMGNLFAALLRELKLWLYFEGVLETGFPLPPAGSHLGSDLSQVEALQRSTLHFSGSQLTAPAEGGSPTASGVTAVALSCATGVKMTEAQLELIESGLRNMHRQNTVTAGGSVSLDRESPLSGPDMGDWLRVPHSPLAGDSLSFHLPLHRALAKSIRSMCSVVVPELIRNSNPRGWWKLPVIDEDYSSLVSDTGAGTQHPLAALIRSSLRSANCRVVWSAGPDCSPAEAHWRRSRAKWVSANIAIAKVIHSIADHPLRCLAAAQQIERHLWARNGASVAGMALNYSSAPLCRSFRDLDLTLLQLSAAGLSIGLGPRRIFSLLLSRFSMDGYLCDPERKASSPTHSSGGFGHGGWINPPRLQDPDHAVALSESFFTTMCLLVTELPPPPPDSPTDVTALRQCIRRELLHALAAEPRSHSEAMEAATNAANRRDENVGITGTSGGGGVLGDVFAEVLREIGKQKTQASSRAASGPPAFELRAECCEEYDPTFFHLRRQEHQHAMDTVARLRRQKAKNNQEATALPLVCPPPRAHPRFLPCRLLLHIEPMDAAIRRALLFALTGGMWLPPPEPLSEEKMQDDFDDSETGITTSMTMPHSDTSAVPVTTIGRRALSRSSSLTSTGRRSMSDSTDSLPFSPEVVATSSVSFIEVLQLLTLQAHTLEECASLHRTQPDVDWDAKTLSAGISINSYLARLVRVPESLVDVWAFKPAPEGPLTSKGSGENRGSILGLLIALYEHRSDHGAGVAARRGSDSGHGDDSHGGARLLAASGLKWLLRFVHALVSGATSVSAASKSAAAGVPIRAVGSHLSTSDWTIYPSIRSKIQGMLYNLDDLWPTEEDGQQQDTADKLNAKSREVGKARQLRMMEMMKRRQDAFASSIAPSENSGTSGIDSKIGEESEMEADLCIICKCDDADGESNGPLGYLGHVQRTRGSQMRILSESTKASFPLFGDVNLFQTYRVVGHRGCQLRATEAMDSEQLVCLPTGSIVNVVGATVSDNYDILSRRVLVRHTSVAASGEKIVNEGWASIQSSEGYVILSPLSSLCFTNTRWGSTRPVIRQCGHAAHIKCVETHTLSLHQRAAGEQPYDGRFAANIDDGEFLCPLCKQLSNILIPRDSCARREAAHSPPSHSKATIGTSENSSILSPDSLRQFMGKEIGKLSDESFTNSEGQAALRQFGGHLYQAMTVSWERASAAKKEKQRRWHPAINQWDFEDEEDDISTTRGPCVKNILRLLRQQHIAWASLGHSAASAEAAARGVEDVLPFGVFAKTADPWADYDMNCRDTHPMLLELKRTLNATSGLIKILLLDMQNVLSSKNGTSGSIPVVGSCLSDILDGRSWILSAASPTVASKTKTENLSLWTYLTALTASVPCHVARDGMISQRHEARAAAAAMWAVKGLGTENLSVQQSNQLSASTDPPAPLAVRQVWTHSTGIQVPSNWGTMDPFTTNKQNGQIPFRPAVASAFLYTPLLAWDLNTFAGAVFSTMLSNVGSANPTTGDLLHAARILLAARMIQSLVTPCGYELSSQVDEDELMESWKSEEIQKEASALARIAGHCQVVRKALSLDLGKSESGKTDDQEAVQLFEAVGRSILPFARTLILLLRAGSSTLRSRQKNSPQEDSPSHLSSSDSHLESLLENEDIMCCEDGFAILKEMGGPLPSSFVCESPFAFEGPSLWCLMNRWLLGVVGLELHHGSRGLSVISSVKSLATGTPSSGTGIKTPQMATMLLDSDSVPYAAMSSAAETSESVAEAAMQTDMYVEEGSDENGGSDEDEDMEEAFDEIERENARATETAMVIQFINEQEFMAEEAGDSEDEMMQETEMDDTDVLMGLAGQPVRDMFVGARGTDQEGQDDTSEDDDSSSSSPDDQERYHDKTFVCVSSSPIVPYQPSLLAMEQVGLGKRGSNFEFAAASSVMCDLSHLGMIHRKGTPTKCLIRLPKSFVELYSIVNRVRGRDDVSVMEDADDSSSTETAICLLTGAVMRSGSSRRPFPRIARAPGACTLHARRVGSGIGIFFLVQKCTVLLMHNNKSAYSASLYVDKNGEEDPNLRRGRPLFLNEARYRALETLWRQQGIPREVAQIRSTSDRVIRDNWY